MVLPLSELGVYCCILTTGPYSLSSLSSDLFLKICLNMLTTFSASPLSCWWWGVHVSSTISFFVKYLLHFTEMNVILSAIIYCGKPNFVNTSCMALITSSEVLLFILRISIQCEKWSIIIRYSLAPYSRTSAPILLNLNFGTDCECDA